MPRVADQAFTLSGPSPARPRDSRERARELLPPPAIGDELEHDQADADDFERGRDDVGGDEHTRSVRASSAITRRAFERATRAMRAAACCPWCCPRTAESAGLQRTSSPGGPIESFGWRRPDPQALSREPP